MIIWVTDVNNKQVAIPIDRIVKFQAVNSNYTATMIYLDGGLQQECCENIVPLTDQYMRLKKLTQTPSKGQAE